LIGGFKCDCNTTVVGTEERMGQTLRLHDRHRHSRTGYRLFQKKIILEKKQKISKVPVLPLDLVLFQAALLPTVSKDHLQQLMGYLHQLCQGHAAAGATHCR